MLAATAAGSYPALMLAASVDFHSPLFWALFIGWILSVVVHEFAHGIVAYAGGDYTIRERGGLTLNPLQYVDPVMSLLLPAIFLLMGGVPLPGGSTFVRRDLLRSRLWSTAVSAAGPASNFLIFIALALALNPKLGWVPRYQWVLDWTPAQRLVGALAFLELLSALLNLVPIPPLDGFQMISPYLSPEIRERLTHRSVSIVCLPLFFFMLSNERVMNFFYSIMSPMTDALGVPLSDLVISARIIFIGHP